MKKKLFFIFLFVVGGFSSYCQTDKYDGDWYHSYNGICGPQYQDDNDNTPLQSGSGKDVYRIRTEDGNTIVLVKRQYPCENEYNYWECSVTRCDEDVLEWHSEINRYKSYGNTNNTIVIEYFCKLRKSGGVLRASIYYLQTEINSIGHVVNSTVYGEDGFSLYKEGLDW